jgi:hypothetical protein
VRRLRAGNSCPALWQPDPVSLFRAHIPAGNRAVILLGLGIEVDSGSDLEMLYAGMADESSLHTWTLEAELPEPVSLVELSDLPPSEPPEAARVQLLRAGLDLHDLCRHDDYVGACVIVLRTDQGADDHWRMRFVSHDRRNDWTAVLRVRF